MGLCRKITNAVLLVRPNSDSLHWLEDVSLSSVLYIPPTLVQVCAFTALRHILGSETAPFLPRF